MLGESAATGLAGAAAGIALGYAGAAIITAVAPTVTATVGSNGGGGGSILIGGSPVQTAAVPLPRPVTDCAPQRSSPSTGEAATGGRVPAYLQT